MLDDEEFEFPRKWLDKKQYVRIDPKTGNPQLIRVEPHFSETNEFMVDVVEIYVDDGIRLLLGRDESNMYLEDTGCVPMDVFAKHKQGNVN
jgi:hypothetical protein